MLGETRVAELTKARVSRSSSRVKSCFRVTMVYIRRETLTSVQLMILRPISVTCADKHTN